MMFKVEFECGKGPKVSERVTRTLLFVAGQVATGKLRDDLLDGNGVTVGRFWLED